MESRAAITEKLINSELRYRRMFEAAQDGILLLDAKTGMIEDVNPYLIKMLGYSHAEFMQKKLWEVGAFKDVEASRQAFEALQKNEYIRYEDLPLRTNDGCLVQVEFVSNVYQEGEEKIIQCNIRDITERSLAEKALVKSEALLRKQSVRDHLTGLFNRRYLEETLEREIARAFRKNLPLSILMVDIDEFKLINDVHGHAAGDDILRELGQVFLENVRAEDIPSRYGGDEFIIVMPDASSALGWERAQHLCEHARHLKTNHDGQILDPITLSIGIATFPENGTTSQTILKAADVALYQAKREGRNRVSMAAE